MSLVTICGPSGAGKSTLIDGILKESSARLVPSWTTRKKRKNDSVIEMYRHISTDEFQKMMRGNQFILVSKVASNYYGTTFEDLELALHSKSIWLIDLTALSIIELLEKGVSPNLSLIVSICRETSKDRMGDRGDKEEDIVKRLLRYDEENSNCKKIVSITNKSLVIDGEKTPENILELAMEKIWVIHGKG